MKLYVLLSVLAYLVLPGILSAQVYYVDPNVKRSGDGSAEQPKKKIVEGLRLLSDEGGDTLILKDGIYEEKLEGFPSGQASAFHHIRAENPGRAVLTGPFTVEPDNAYLRFIGIKWSSAFSKFIQGHHIAFKDCAFEGGPASGNSVNVGIGTNDRTPGAHHILIEDSWAYGNGGRYNFLIYNSESVILRRVIARHDGGWKGSGYDPEAGIIIYNSSQVEIQNGIVFDSNLDYQYWESAFYTVKNESSEQITDQIRISGSIALNNPHGSAFGIDSGPVTQYSIDNSVAWNNYGGVSQNGYGNDVSLDQLSLGNSQGVGVALWSGNDNRLEIKNSIVLNSALRGFQNNGGKMDSENILCFPNSSKDPWDCQQAKWSFNPVNEFFNNLLFPLTIDLQNEKKLLGATIQLRIGRDGSFYGDQQFDAVTEHNLWPWPNEQRIKSDLCEKVQRGLCSTPLSLTEYLGAQLTVAR